MTPYETSGVIAKIFPTQEIRSNGFKKRTMILEPKGQEGMKYKNLIALTVMKDRCGEFDDFAEGIEVKAKFYVNSKIWNDRVFTELMLAKDGLVRLGEPVKTPPPATPPEDVGADAASDDLPF